MSVLENWMRIYKNAGLVDKQLFETYKPNEKDLYEQVWAIISFANQWKIFGDRATASLGFYSVLLPVHVLLPKKPVIWINGKQKTGKTTFLKQLEKLWSPIAVYVDAEEQLPQVLSDSTKVVLADEIVPDVSKNAMVFFATKKYVFFEEDVKNKVLYYNFLGAKNQIEPDIEGYVSAMGYTLSEFRTKLIKNLLNFWNTVEKTQSDLRAEWLKQLGLDYSLLELLEIPFALSKVTFGGTFIFDPRAHRII